LRNYDEFGGMDAAVTTALVDEWNIRLRKKIHKATTNRARKGVDEQILYVAAQVVSIVYNKSKLRRGRGFFYKNF
jgi:hypothetical protein